MLTGLTITVSTMGVEGYCDVDRTNNHCVNYGVKGIVILTGLIITVSATGRRWQAAPCSVMAQEVPQQGQRQSRGAAGV